MTDVVSNDLKLSPDVTPIKYDKKQRSDNTILRTTDHIDKAHSTVESNPVQDPKVLSVDINYANQTHSGVFRLK